MKETLADREGQLRMALLNLETSEKEKANIQQLLENAESNSQRLTHEQEGLRKVLQSTEADCRDKERQISHLQSAVANIQSDLNETVEQLNQKSVLNKKLKTEQEQLDRDKQGLLEEVSMICTTVSMSASLLCQLQ